MIVQTDGTIHFVLAESPLCSKIGSNVTLEVTRPSGEKIFYDESCLAVMHAIKVVHAMVEIKSEGTYRLKWSGVESQSPLEAEIEVLHTQARSVLS